MSDPTVKVEAAFGYSPTDPNPVWTDITRYVKGFDTKRGRNTELDTIDAGTATVTLDNATGLFTPRVGRPANLILNPSVEADATYWAASSSTTSSGRVAGGFKGGYCFEQVGPQSSYISYNKTSGLAPVSGGTYGVRVWVRGTGSAQLEFRAYDASNVELGEINPPTVALDPDVWVAIEGELVAPAGTATLWPIIWQRDAAGGTIHADELEVTLGGLLPPTFDPKPRTPLKITASIQAEHPIAYGVIERWPLDLNDSAPTMDVPVVDMSKVLSDVKMGNSDTGMLERTGPDIYFPMQESDAGLLDTINGFKLLAFWDAYLAPPHPTDNNPLPEITYGADSILPSESGSAVNLGGYWVEQN